MTWPPKETKTLKQNVDHLHHMDPRDYSKRVFDLEGYQDDVITGENFEMV